MLPESWIDDELPYSGCRCDMPRASDGPRSWLSTCRASCSVPMSSDSCALGPCQLGQPEQPDKSRTLRIELALTGRASSVDPDWFMRWYFNFDNREGLAFHLYALPGHPASHGCIRLLERDAQWLFEWGETWVLDPSATRAMKPGTPVLIVGAYDFDAAPPWRSLTWLSQPVDCHLYP